MSYVYYNSNVQFQGKVHRNIDFVSHLITLSQKYARESFFKNEFYYLQVLFFFLFFQHYNEAAVSGSMLVVAY